MNDAPLTQLCLFCVQEMGLCHSSEEGPRVRAAGRQGPIAIGSRVPDVKLFVGHPPEQVEIAKRIAGKKVIVVGLPGAFTPT